MSEGKRSYKKIDKRTTNTPRTIRIVVSGMAHDTPEQTRAAWDAGEIQRTFSARTLRFMKYCKDLVIILAQREERANHGIVDMLTVEVRRKNF